MVGEFHWTALSGTKDIAGFNKGNIGDKNKGMWIKLIKS